jgi:hypothetical protein
MERTLYMIALTIGGFIGGYVPALWGGSMFSLTGLFFSTLGSIAGIWLVYKLKN